MSELIQQEVVNEQVAEELELIEEFASSFTDIMVTFLERAKNEPAEAALKSLEVFALASALKKDMMDSYSDMIDHYAKLDTDDVEDTQEDLEDMSDIEQIDTVSVYEDGFFPKEDSK